MNESDVVERLVEFTDMTLASLSVFFTIVSAYVAALNYFVGRAPLAARLAAFLFLSFVFALLLAILTGALQLHAGLIARLGELGAQHQLTAAGRAALGNSSFALIEASGERFSLDRIVQTALFGGVGLTYLGLFALTFVFPWRDHKPQPA